MADKWRTVPAEKFCNSVRDGTHDSPKPVDQGRYLVTSRHITGGQLDFANAYFISEKDFEEINKRSKVDRWDVLISMIGTVGEPYLIKEEPHFAIKNIGLFKTRGETEGKWLFYYLRSPYAKQLIRELSRGTTQQYIPLGALREFPIPAPDDRDQMCSITHILGTLDDKIELNRKMNETLEEMVRVIFKSWFIDFDPVRAKVEGRWKKGQSLPGMPAEMFDLWPDSFVNSPLGPIPKGWKAGNLSEEIDMIGGGTPKTSIPEYWNGDIPWFSVVDTPNSSDIWVLDTEKHISQAGIENSSTKLLSKGTTIITARGTVGNLALVARPMAMNQSCYGLKGKDKRGDYYIYFKIYSEISDLQKSTHGSVFDTIIRETFEGIDTVIPPSPITNSFDLTIEPILSRILNNCFESRTLAVIRDSLLSKLLSGEIRVKDVEKK